jgi:branched-subunit amino acid aminotransferase/4-amino-4-deoxychorismate lyase
VIVYLNGTYLPAEQAQVGIFDGGYMYGDGIYTTLRLYKGLPLDLIAHWERLKTQTAQLELAFELTVEELREIIARLLERNDLGGRDGRLRISVSRSGDPQNPLPLKNLISIPATVVITLMPVSPELARWQADGIPVICLEEGSARGNFPQLKTLNALATLRALRQAAAAGCPEAILTGSEGRLLEGAVSNIFLVSGDQLVTPGSVGEFLAGRTRERILQIATREQITVRQRVIDRRHLAAACEVFVVSSVREVLPVVSIDGDIVGDGTPGPMTRLFQSKYRELIARDLAAQ